MKLLLKHTNAGQFSADAYANFFRCVAAKDKMCRVASVEDTMRSLDARAVSSSILWDTPKGAQVLERSELSRIAREALRVNAGKATTTEAAVREAQKADLVTTFKDAMKFLDKEMKRIQKDLGEDAPTEQIFSIAYEALQDEIPAFCAIWDKFALIKGLDEKGWRVRAQQVEAKSPYHDHVLSLQQLIGPKLGTMEFQSMSEGHPGVLSLHYGAVEDGVNLHFWYAPTGSAYEINVERGGKIVSTLREDNPELLESFLQSAASAVCERWGALRAKTAADQIVPDEADHSIPEALGPDRSCWSQVSLQVYHATRDFLRQHVTHLPLKMILWRDAHNGDAFEHHMRGDREPISALIRGSLSLGETHTLELECVYAKGSIKRTVVESFDLDDYATTSDLVEDVQDYLEECLERELKRLVERSTTIRDVLQKAIPQGF